MVERLSCSRFSEVESFVQCILESRPVEKGYSGYALAAMETVHRIYSQDKAIFQV
ncbi:MAG: hypothetical protein HW380_3267 [Magnetococcales bacterium]|nr:hypothetical protein [Magnetococcales bacterium]